MAASEPIENRLRMLRRSIQTGDLARAQALLAETTRRPAVGLAGRAPAAGAAGVGTAAPDWIAGAPARPAAREPVPLEQACAGTLSDAGRRGRFWLIHRTMAEVQPKALLLPRQYAAIIGGARQRWDELEASAALCKAADGRPEDLLFMDIETCGLSAAPVFLIGMMTYAEGGFQFEQYLARDYTEEPAILDAFAARLEGAEVLVTFNGKSFDMSYLRQRSAFHGVPLPARLAHHLDLLHESRRRWRGCVPNCRLQTLEQLLCGRRRVGDIPGSQIPDAYHAFVRTGDARAMAAIVHHNLLDLLTMGELVCHLLSGAAPTE